MSGDGTSDVAVPSEQAPSSELINVSMTKAYPPPKASSSRRGAHQRPLKLLDQTCRTAPGHTCVASMAPPAHLWPCVMSSPLSAVERQNLPGLLPGDSVPVHCDYPGDPLRHKQQLAVHDR